MKPTKVSEVVKSGLCIGCGLCEAVTGGRVTMQINAAGAMRPTTTDDFSAAEEKIILSACPGAGVSARCEAGLQEDDVWGTYGGMFTAWAANADIRFRAATGGVLTALGVYMLRSGQAKFILQIAVAPAAPARSRWVMSETPDEVIAAAGSRYGPTSPLAGLYKALEREQPFAIIAKPCDLSAVHGLAQVDERVNRLCVARMVMVCGGQSRFGKTISVLDEAGFAEREVSVFRYRGYGNPGRTRVETLDGRVVEKTYAEMWGNEKGWEIDSLCKFCADAIGEAADIASADIWPGGTPTGEDAGFNGVIVRTARGQEIIAAAQKAGDLCVGEEITPRQFDDYQPHQVAKKEKLSARFAGRTRAGLPSPTTDGLRIEKLGKRLSASDAEKETAGTEQRARNGRFTEE